MNALPIRSVAARLRQQGLTLVEMLVGMVLMLLVIMATVALFSVTSSSYRTVDAGQELEDNARFAFEIIGQAIRQAGFQERTGPPSAGNLLADSLFVGPPAGTWRIEGRSAQTLTGRSSLSYSGSNVVNGSDALIIRFFGSNLPDPSNPSVPLFSGTNPVADGTMIDCSGRPVPYPTGATDMGHSAFFVRVNSGSSEPELACQSWNSATSEFSQTQIIKGVEAFQVMYGVDTDPTPDEVVDRWVSADAAWDDPAANPNWNRVVAIRVGMVLRGPVGSGQGASATSAENEYYPMGRAFTCESATATASCSPSEAGLKFTAPADTRLRRVFTTTFHVRNTVL
jgi:type IV pilus assembly protein PilW